MYFNRNINGNKDDNFLEGNEWDSCNQHGISLYVSQEEAKECSGRNPFSISFDDWEEGVGVVDKSEGVVNRKRKLSTLRIALGFQHLKDKKK